MKFLPAGTPHMICPITRKDLAEWTWSTPCFRVQAGVTIPAGEWRCMTSRLDSRQAKLTRIPFISRTPMIRSLSLSSGPIPGQRRRPVPASSTTWTSKSTHPAAPVIIRTARTGPAAPRTVSTTWSRSMCRLRHPALGISPSAAPMCRATARAAPTPSRTPW